MADEPTTTDDGTETEAPATDAPADPPKDDKPLGPNGEKALKSERERANTLEKELKALQAKLAEATKSDDEKLTDRLAALEEQLAAEKADKLRLTVGAELGLSPKQSSHLVGKTEDELKAHAQALIEDFGQPTAPRANPLAPPTVRPAATPPAGVVNDPEALLERVAKRLGR
jgi:hypothetical protein